MRRSYFNMSLAICLILLAVSLRILPHPANFAPLAAVSIFGGAVLPRRLALWVPLAAMVLSDAVIGFHSLIGLTWGSYVLIALASSYLLRKPSFLKGGVLTLSSSLFFFVVTNFGVWVASGMYSHTWSGLVQCYTLALPFFRNTLLSDVIYTGLLFGTFSLVTKANYKHLKLLVQTNN